MKNYSRGNTSKKGMTRFRTASSFLVRKSEFIHKLDSRGGKKNEKFFRANDKPFYDSKG
jgi:hypothetical protein